LAAAVASSGASAVDAIVALPLAPARQRERGFNQAHEIARRVSARLGVPLAAPLVRPASRQPQTMLPWSARARNVRGAFTCVGDVHMLRIAVVDDVMTTGATLAEATRTLLAAGASRIDAWVVARTLAPEPSR
jgi:ComF family protein